MWEGKKHEVKHKQIYPGFEPGSLIPFSMDMTAKQGTLPIVYGVTALLLVKILSAKFISAGTKPIKPHLVEYKWIFKLVLDSLLFEKLAY